MEKAVRLLRAGLDFLHLRKPGFSEVEMEAYLNALPGIFLPRTVLHSHPALALEHGCLFQLNSRWPQAELPSERCSASCHSLAEVKKVAGRGLAFATLSPIFDSISKPGYLSAFGEEEALPEGAGIPLIALGGVDFQNMETLPGRGFSGAALMGAVWERPGGEEELLKVLLMRNLGFQFITDGRDPHDGGRTVEQALQALRGGCRWIQVRMKEAPTAIVASVLERLLPECEQRGATLIVDDHVELARLCHGVHLGQNDMPLAEARKILGNGKIIGLTINCEKHLNIQQELPDYYGVGPFRHTTTKANLAPLLGLDGYRRLAPLLPRPFVAIGGIELEDITAIQAAGASGVALSGALTRSPNPQQTAAEAMKIISQQRNNKQRNNETTEQRNN